MQPIKHTIDASTDEKFETAGNAVVSIRGCDDDNTLSVKLLPKDGREAEEWDWDNDTVVKHLINGNVIPQEGNATDYLEA